jgi:hypothetical protein
MEDEYSSPLSKIIKNFNSLSAGKKHFLMKSSVPEICLIIREFIPHFLNFNFEISESIDMLVELCTKYKVEKEKIGFFVTMLNSSVYTIKNRLNNSGVINENEKRKKLLMNLSKVNDFRVTIISSSLKYLKMDEYMNLISLNKQTYKKISKMIYKHILNKEGISLNTRVEIWKSILEVVSNN